MIKPEYKLNENGLFNIYEYFKSIRKEANLSQRDISSNLDISYATLSRYETGEIKPTDCRVLFKYCKLFGISDEIALEFYKILLNKETTFSFEDIKYTIDKKGQINELEILKLGKFFLEERKKKNLTQKDIQNKIGLIKTKISNIENTTKEIPTLNLIIPLCKFYNISDDEFIKFYCNVIGIEKKKSFYLTNSDIKFLEQTIKSQEIIIKEQQKMIEQLNKQLILARTR